MIPTKALIGTTHVFSIIICAWPPRFKNELSVSNTLLCLHHVEGQEGSAYCTSLNSAECLKKRSQPQNCEFGERQAWSSRFSWLTSSRWLLKRSFQPSGTVGSPQSIKCSKTPNGEANREAQLNRGMLLKIPELIENEQGLHTVTSSQAGLGSRHERVRPQIFTTEKN